MTKKIKVILLARHQTLGSAGDIVNVTEGYARNFLFPQGLAALADEAATRQVHERAAAAAKQTQAQLAAEQELAERLSGTELTLSARLKESEGDEIYGSVTSREIIEQLNQQAGLKLKANQLKLSKKITRLGSYPITLSLSPQTDAELVVTVVAANPSAHE